MSQLPSLARNVLTVGGATMASRALGFVRDVLAAALMGAGPAADAFYVAFRLPNVLRSLFAEGSMTMAFVPVYSRTIRESGVDAASRTARSAFVWLAIILGLACVAVAWNARAVVGLVAPGFTDDPALWDMAATFVRRCFPYVLFISHAALLAGVLNAAGRFLAPALSPCLLNLALIGAFGVSWLAGLGPGSSDAVASHQAWAVLVGGHLQLVYMARSARKSGFSLWGGFRLNDPGVVRMGRIMLPSAAGSATYQLNVLLGTLLASLLPSGAVSSLYFADRLVQLPLGVFGVAVGVAALPSLSRLAAEKRLEEYRVAVNAAIGLALFLALPCAAGLVALREPIIQVLFQRGAFDAAAAEATSRALVAYCVGLPAFACVRPLLSALYALENARAPVVASAACMLVNVGLGYLLMWEMGHAGLALAVSVASWLNVVLLGFFLTRAAGSWWRGTRKTLLQALAAAAMGLLGWFAAGFGWVSLILIPGLFVLYCLACAALGMEEAVLMRDAVVRRFSRRVSSKTST